MLSTNHIPLPGPGFVGMIFLGGDMRSFPQLPLSLHSVRKLLLIAGLVVSWSNLVASLRAEESALGPSLSIASQEVEASAPSKRIELTAKETRTLSFNQPFVRAEVFNPELIEAYQPDEKTLQLFGKQPGVGHVRVYDARNHARTFEVAVLPDTSELEFVLHSQFPSASLKVVPFSSGVMLSGFVQDAEQVDQIVGIAEDFHPRILQNIKLCSPQQVLLHVRVMEVSRTKLRALGFDLRCGIVGDGRGGHGFLDALREYDLAKVLAEPTLVAISGRSASFRAGGEFPIIVPGALGTNSIEYKSYGMEINFVPKVFAGNRIRLEVRPRISEIDPQTRTKLGKHRVPSLNVRQVDTVVEMRAGQTLALAGLIQNRVEAENRGIPLLADIPYLGMPFRHVYTKDNEIELLITVRPELIEPFDSHQVCPGGPGLNSTTPSRKALFCRGHLEVPYRYSGPIEPVIPNSAYDQFLPEVDAHEVIDPNPFPRLVPVTPESLPLGSLRNNDESASTSVGVAGEKFPLNSTDGLIGPVGYETDP